MKKIAVLIGVILLASCSDEVSDKKNEETEETNATTITTTTATTVETTKPERVDHKQEKQFIKDCFEAYKKNALAGDGRATANLVNTNTINYFNNILQAVKSADSIRISSMALIDRIMVLSVRHKIDMNTLLTMSSNDLFAYAIENGMVSKQSLPTMKLGDVTFNGNVAKAQYITSDNTYPLFFEFTKEEGTWKIDLTSMMGAANESLQSYINSIGKEENAFIMEALQSGQHVVITNDIWKPLMK